MIRVFTVDEHEVFRIGLKAIFADTSDIRVVGEAGRTGDALSLISLGKSDVLILEISSVGSKGMELIRQARQKCPRVAVLVLTAQIDEEYANRALKAGATGFLTKHSSPAEICEAVRKVASGRVHVSDEIAEHLMLQLCDLHKQYGHQELSTRELDVFLRLAVGKGCTEIAKELSLSVKTISTHKARIMDKLQLTSTAELVQYAIAHKLVEVYVV